MPKKSVLDKYTEEERKEIIEKVNTLRSSGVKLKQIATELGVPYIAVLRLKDPKGLSNLTFYRIPEEKRLVRRPMTPEEREEILKLYSQGNLTMKDISNRTQFTYNQVRYAISETYREYMRTHRYKRSPEEEKQRNKALYRRRRQIRDEAIPEVIDNVRDK